MKNWIKAGCLLLILATIALTVTACSADKENANANANQQSAVSSAVASAASQVPSSAATDQPMSAEELAKALKSAGLPIENIIVYTEDNDPNKLLGRPNQYISKANFADTTVEQESDKGNPVGGSIETFSNAADLKTRKDYCESISKSSPMFAQYYYVNGNYLLRIDNDVTPTNAKKYEAAFAKIGQ